jgi:glycosyltransferase involved in cell wall biosynthesis
VRPLRLVLMTRRFWPLMGRGASVMANLAVELASRNVEVTLLTARWSPRWPAQITYRGASVVRVAKPPGGARDTNRYTRSLARWLRRNQGRYDLVCVSMLRHEAYAAVTAVRSQVPVVLRAESAGRLGDCLWQLDTSTGRRIKKQCIKADALVGPSRQIERELIAAGYPRRRIHYLPHGVPIPPAPDAGGKAAARTALVTANPALRMPDETPLAVYVGRLDEAKGLGYLVAAWPRIAAALPEARLWLVGEGPYRKALEERIVDLDLLGRVFLAGVFDGVDEVLAAADLFVLPSREEGPSLALLEAMAAALPIVTTDLAGNRELVTDGEHGLLVPAKDADALSAAVVRLLAERELAVRLGAAARHRAQGQFTLAQTADAHLNLFETLLTAHPSQAQP